MSAFSRKTLALLMACAVFVAWSLLSSVTCPSVRAERLHPQQVTPTPGLPDTSTSPPPPADGTGNREPANQPVLDDSVMKEDTAAAPLDVIYIWPPAQDSFIWSGQPNVNYGSAEDMWVSDGFRSLIRWDLSSLPSRAMLSYSEAIISLVENWGPDMNVCAHPLSNPWTENGVTWNSRDGTSNWYTPGGDFGPLAEHVTSVGTALDQYRWTLTDLVAEWHSGHWTNYGILLQPETYPASATKQFGSREGSGWRPELDVYYTLGPVSLSVYVPFAWGVPSPDWYRVSRGDYWNAVAIHPPSGTDYDLMLSSTAEYTDGLAYSTWGGNAVDFVVIDGNHAPAGNCYPKVYQYLGRGQYSIEHAANTMDLAPGTYGPYTIQVDEVIRVWDINLADGTTYCIAVRPTAGDADLGISLHKSNEADTSTYYQGRSQAVAERDMASSGAGEYMVHTANGSDWYGLTVWNKGATLPTTYNMYVDTTPPTGSISIAGDALYVNTTSVTLDLGGTDSDTGVVSVGLTNSGSNWQWSNYSSSHPWTLTSGDGLKTVYAQFQNYASMTSGTYTDTITLDQTFPTAQASCSSETDEMSFAVNWTGNDSTSGIATYDVQYRVGIGGAWTPWLAGTTMASATFGPGSPVTVHKGETYYFRARARDRAGNAGQYAAGNGDCSCVKSPPTYIPLVQRNYGTYAAPCGPANGYCEPYNTPGTAYGSLAFGVGYLAYPNDTEDYYYFNLTSTANVRVRVTNFKGGGGKLMVYAENNIVSPVPGGYWGTGGETMTVEPANLSRGKFYIRVYTGGSTNTTMLYTLTVTTY